ncbi:MAG: hypothetical protein Q4G45_06670 [Actinomycetia bacterium]|nr:hypothetical protein [Actinomycetes bacterium]
MLNRGSVTLELFANDGAHLMPWLRERLGEQELIWCARATAAEACEAVISVKHWDEGTNQGLFAGQALTAVMQHLEALGGRIDGVQAVSASRLPADCPAHLTTRVLLAREARRLR